MTIPVRRACKTVCFEESGGVFCSANHMLLTGSGARKIIDGNWKAVLDGVFTDRVPKKVPLALIKKKFSVLMPKIAAVDNGFCVKVQNSLHRKIFINAVTTTEFERFENNPPTIATTI